MLPQAGRLLEGVGERAGKAEREGVGGRQVPAVEAERDDMREGGRTGMLVR